LVFVEGGKPEKNPSKHRREPTTNSTHISPELGNQTRTTAMRSDALTAHATHASSLASSSSSPWHDLNTIIL
jgi:hypothetical protein